jgi:hypothetical protein
MWASQERNSFAGYHQKSNDELSQMAAKLPGAGHSASISESAKAAEKKM